MNHQKKAVYEDILPGYVDAIPTKLSQFAELIHLASMRLPLSLDANAARFHMCVYLAAERLHQRLGLPEPERQKIPCRPKVMEKALNELRSRVVDELSTPIGSPVTTPTKPRRSSLTPLGTPTSSPTKQPPLPLKHLPRKLSPLKRLREAAAEDDDDDGLNTPARKRRFPGAVDLPPVSESPFNPDPTTPTKLLHDRDPLDSDEDFVESPSKSPALSPSKSSTSPSKPSSKTSIPKKVLYDRRVVKIVDFVKFANTFYIPDIITTKLLNSFARHRDKFKKRGEWPLACGLVYGAYKRINHRRLEKLGETKNIIDKIHTWQKGGMTREYMELFFGIVEDYVRNEAWVRQLERDYMGFRGKERYEQERSEYEARTGGTPEAIKHNELLVQLGAMVTGANEYQLQAQQEYYEVWKQNALAKAAARSQSPETL